MPAHPPPATAGTPAALFADAFAADPARPLIIWYDDAISARVELSVATMANWVAKTGNLLQDTVGASGGERLALALPPHWFAPVFLLAGFCTGMVLDLDSLQGADVAAVGPDTVAAGVGADAGELVVCGTAPLGGPCRGELPDGALDFGAEAPGHGDLLQPVSPVSADSTALVAGGRTFTGAELVSAAAGRAAELELPSGARVATSGNPADPDGILDALLAPLAVGGSIVLIANPDPAARQRRLTDERVTVEL